MTEINPSLVQARSYEAKMGQGMKDRSYCKAHYVIELDLKRSKKTSNRA